MKLNEIVGRTQLELQGWIAVPRGSLWQKEISNVWVFDSHEEAQDASHTDAAMRYLDRMAGWLVPIETLNNIHLLMAVSDKGFHSMKEVENFHVYAYSVSEKSCRAAAVKAMTAYGIEHKTGHDNFARGDNIWCYKTWNSDTSFFKDEE